MGAYATLRCRPHGISLTTFKQHHQPQQHPYHTSTQQREKVRRTMKIDINMSMGITNMGGSHCGLPHTNSFNANITQHHQSARDNTLSVDDGDSDDDCHGTNIQGIHELWDAVAPFAAPLNALGADGFFVPSGQHCAFVDTDPRLACDTSIELHHLEDLTPSPNDDDWSFIDSHDAIGADDNSIDEVYEMVEHANALEGIPSTEMSDMTSRSQTPPALPNPPPPTSGDDSEQSRKIFAGRGGDRYKNAGNEVFLRRVADKYFEYNNASTAPHKRRIINSIIGDLQTMGYVFVAADGTTEIDEKSKFRKVQVRFRTMRKDLKKARNS